MGKFTRVAKLAILIFLPRIASRRVYKITIRSISAFLLEIIHADLVSLHPRRRFLACLLFWVATELSWRLRRSVPRAFALSFALAFASFTFQAIAHSPDTGHVLYLSKGSRT